MFFKATKSMVEDKLSRVGASLLWTMNFATKHPGVFSLYALNYGMQLAWAYTSPEVGIHLALNYASTNTTCYMVHCRYKAYDGSSYGEMLIPNVSPKPDNLTEFCIKASHQQPVPYFFQTDIMVQGNSPEICDISICGSPTHCC